MQDAHTHDADSFWSLLHEAFVTSDGFTVHFILRGGVEMEISMAPDGCPEYITGSLLHEGFSDRVPVTIRAADVMAYWIDEG